jgi:hypothetical protein
MSAGLVRARPQITGPRTSREMACTASKSPGLAAGKPTSMISTPKAGQFMGQADFFLFIHGSAGRLLAVAQGRIKD